MKRLVKKFSLAGAFALASPLSIFANGPCSPNQPTQTAGWAQAAYPDFCGVNFNMGSAFGVSSYTIKAIPIYSEYIEGEYNAFTLGFTQTLSIYDWFYLQLREDFSLGFADEATLNGNNDYLRRVRKSYFFDSDAKLYVPFSLSASNRISLQPVIGFAVHQAYIRGNEAFDDMPKNTLLRQRFFAPLFGFALGYNPTKMFALRSSINMHFPHGKHRQPAESFAIVKRYSTLRESRHGMSMDLLALAQLSSNWTLTAEIDYLAYRVYGPRLNTSSRWNKNYTTRLSAKIGAAYSF